MRVEGFFYKGETSCAGRNELIMIFPSSEEQKIKDDKNVRRILREQEKVAANMQVTVEEHQKVFAINTHIRDQLHREQEKAFRVEELLKVRDNVYTL